MNIFSKMTLRNLRINRTRTIVTIIGILLSTAMFTAVTSSVSSFQQFMADYASYNYGSWHIQATNFSKDSLDSLQEEDKVGELVALKEYGFSRLEDCKNKNKPYLCVYGIPENATDLLPLHLTQGQLPQSSSEILLPNHLQENGGISYELGDTITLSIGARLSDDGEYLNNHVGYYLDNGESEQEVLSNPKEYTYTVVGFYERPTFEDYQAPGYSALTLDTGNFSPENDHCYDVFFCMKNIKDASSFFQSYPFPKGSSYSQNYSLLRAYGASSEDSLNAVLYSLALILILIIVFGSVSLIYNSFSISISERTKQLGILSSLGATRKQLLQSVISEGFFLSIIGIPLGILSGLLGIGITFFSLGDNFQALVSTGKHVALTLHPSWTSILLAVLLSLFTIFLSAYLPARKALRHTAIEVIRQNDEIKIYSKKLQVSKLTQKLFGFEGTLSMKNFKRNHRKYRSTIFSLFISVVLFISVSSFAAYLMKSAQGVYTDYGYDVNVSFYPTEDETSFDLVEDKFLSLDGITDHSYYTAVSITLSMNPSAFTTRYAEYQQEIWSNLCPGVTPKEDVSYASIVFVEDSRFSSYLEEHGIDPSGYFDPTKPKAILVDSLYLYSNTDNRYHTFQVIGNLKQADLAFRPAYEKDNFISYTWYQESDGKFYCDYELEDTSLTVPFENATAKIAVNCDAILDEGPDMVFQSSYYPVLYYPYSQIDHLFEDYAGNDFCDLSAFPLSQNSGINFTFQCEDHAALTDSLNQLFEEHPNWSGYVDDCAKQTENDISMITIINVFCYGFIILISLIAAANVFNTISTNIQLRRREFAMLKSVGMTPKGFQKMMNLECFFYGVKGLLYGLPAAFLLTWFIYRAVSNGIDMDFFIPWYSVLIAIVSVFLVVFSTMLYTMSKIRKENTIDALKDESF
ncbi:MAG: ABC transporter permease [Roseburia sp.]